MEDIHTPGKRHARQEALRTRATRAEDRRALVSRPDAAEPSTETESLLESVFRAAPIGIGLVRNRVLIEVNDRLCTMTGYEAEELIGQSARVLYPTQEDFDYVGTEKYRQIVEHGTGSVETRWRRRDGMIRDVLLSSTPIDPSDMSKGVTFTVLDITEHRRALREKDSAARFPSENPYPVFRVTATGKVAYANPASLDLLKDHDAHSGDLAPPHWRALVHQALSSGIIGKLEVEHRGRTFAFHAVPLPSVQYVNFYGTDITDRKQAEERLREQELHEKQRVEAELADARDELVRKTRLAAIGQMSASIAHDLRNPLGAVRNAAYLLRRRLPQDQPRLLDPVAIIEQEVARADRIITNLLNLTRSRSPNKEAVDMGSLVRRIFENTRNAEGVQCRFSFSTDPFIIQADVGQFTQVLANLLDNAVEAMGGRGELWVEASRKEDCDVLTLRDTGPGWPEDVRDRLFEPLVTTKTTGTGLGLAICRQIVESHDGTIEAVESATKGATIRIMLPSHERTSS